MYKFINKETGEIKFGIAAVAGEGYDLFNEVLEDGTLVEGAEQIRVENPNMDANPLLNDTYTVELVATGLAAETPVAE